jgi:hypothetical protein
MDATRTPTRSLRRPARLGEYGRARTASAGYEQPPFRGTEIGGGPAHNLPEETTLRRRIWRRAALGSLWVSFPIPGRRPIRRNTPAFVDLPEVPSTRFSPTSRDSESSGFAPISALVINRRSYTGNGAENFGTTAGDCLSARFGQTRREIPENRRKEPRWLNARSVRSRALDGGSRCSAHARPSNWGRGKRSAQSDYYHSVSWRDRRASSPRTSS